MPNASEAGPSSGMQFNFSNSQAKVGGNIASGNTSVAGQNNTLNQTFCGFPESDDKVEKVLSWLAPHAADYLPAHEEAHSRQTPGTGAWFFDSQTYTIWKGVDSSGPGLPNLECVGIPGAGKTTLASAVIENLQPGNSTPNPGDREDSNIVLYIYFRHDTQSHQTIPNVLASLLQQVAQIKRNISDELYKLYEACARSGIIPAPDRILNILRVELSGFHKVFIVVDALDEYSVESYSSSHALVSELERLNARLLITSRHHVDFAPNTSCSLHIAAHAEDIRILVSDYVKGNLAKIIARAPSLFEEIVTTIVTKAEGMFIIARLLIESLPDLLTSADVRIALQMLPTGLRDTYLMTMKRIWQQKPHIVQLAKKALAWVFLAKRRLRVLELQHAVSFRLEERIIPAEDMIAEDTILSSCLGLVVFVKNKKDILECQFAHFTTKEFLETCWQEYFSDGERQITQTCLSYLAATVSAIPRKVTERVTREESLHNRDDVEWQQYRTSEYALSVYAATFWGAHAKVINGTLSLDAYASFFKHPISPFMANRDRKEGIGISPPISMPPVQYWTLHFARFGLLEHLQRHEAVIKKRDNVQVSLDYNAIREDRGWTALHLSALYGNLKVVEFLLHSCADVNQLDNRNGSPLHLAVQAGSPKLAMVQLLLNHGAIVDQPDIWQRAPIACAISPYRTSTPPSPEIISLLLRHEIDIYRVDVYDRTPLSLAQNSKNPKIKQLLEEYSRIHPPRRRAYEQRFPGRHFSAVDSVSEEDFGLDWALPAPGVVHPTTSGRQASPTNSRASGALDPCLSLQPLTQLVRDTPSGRTPIMDPGSPTPMPPSSPTKAGPQTKIRFRKFFTAVARLVRTERRLT